jgi:hypothetical protein
MTAGAPQLTARALSVHALAIAEGYAEAGTLEQGNNRGDQVQWFQHAAGGVPGESWCADFVYACILKAYCQAHNLLIGATDHDNRAIMLAHADAMSAEFHIPRTGSCIAIADVAVKQFRFRTPHFRPAAGDLVLYDFHGQGEPHHVGFVRGVQPDGVIRTVEGNTGPGDTGSQGDGDGVYLRVRGRSKVYGFVHW